MLSRFSTGTDHADGHLKIDIPLRFIQSAEVDLVKKKVDSTCNGLVDRHYS